MLGNHVIRKKRKEKKKQKSKKGEVGGLIGTTKLNVTAKLGVVSFRQLIDHNFHAIHGMKKQLHCRYAK